MESEEPLSIEHPENNKRAKSFVELREEYRARKDLATLSPGRLLTFTGVPEGKDVYNPSGPFLFEDDTYMWARIESRDKQDAVAMLFRKTDRDTFAVVEGAPVLPLEDPFMTVVGAQFIIGGVEIAKDEHDRVIGYKTAFYKGPSPYELQPFALGPDSMKDIRIADMSSGLMIFTRPYIPVGARMLGRIAVTKLETIDELTPERLSVESTEILPDLFADTEWGGANDTYVFENGLVGALCHVSMFDEDGKRHYAAAALVMDARTGMCSPLEMIAERADFPDGPVKVMPENLDTPEMHDDLADVIFSARLMPVNGTLEHSATAELTCGLSDAAVGVVEIENPFPRLIAKYFT